MSIYVPDEGKSILLVGDSGTHKTWFIGTCPTPYIFDFDKGLAILRGRELGYGTFKDAPYNSPKSVINKDRGIYEWGTAWPAFLTKLNELGGMIEKGNCPYKTLGLDSITTLGMITMNYVLKANSRTPTEGPRIQDWGAQIGLLETVIDQLTSWTAFIKVVTAHIQRDTNMLTQTVEKLPLVTGKLAGKLSIYFDEVWFADVKAAAAGKPESERAFFLKTVSDGTFRQAKSRFGVPNGTATNWSAVAPYIQPPVVSAT